MVPISRRADGPEMLARVFIYVMFLYTWIGLGLSVLSVEVVELVPAEVPGSVGGVVSGARTVIGAEAPLIALALPAPSTASTV
jgi:hypothetical protein